MKKEAIVIESSVRVANRVFEIIRDSNIEKIFDVHVEQEFSDKWFVMFNEDEHERENLVDEILSIFHASNVFEIEVN